jgi:thiamine-monophosphate kinase
VRGRNHNEEFLLKKIKRGAGLGKQTPRFHSLSLGIGDDAALFRPKPGHETILTCDWFLEGTHFLRDRHPPDSVGWKCLARAVSDVAAMGGVPRYFLLSLALPDALTGRWLSLFLGGLRRASRKFHCALAGGDTTRRNKILINVTVLGEVKAGHAVLRSGARDGDVVCVSGRLGEAELGLQILKRSRNPSEKRNPNTRKQLYPEPRLELGRWLAEKRLATAMMDLSDGLSSDLARLCSASGVGALIGADYLPCIKPVDTQKSGSKFPTPTELALHGGEDYELLFAVKRRMVPSLPGKFRGLPIHPIGYITSGPNVVLGERRGPHLDLRVLTPGGWDPFRTAR